MLFRYFKKSVTWDLYTVHIIQESLFFISPLYSIIQVAIAHQIRGLNGTEFTFLIKYKIVRVSMNQQYRISEHEILYYDNSKVQLFVIICLLCNTTHGNTKG
jgi:hypothetical protein